MFKDAKKEERRLEIHAFPQPKEIWRVDKIVRNDMVRLNFVRPLCIHQSAYLPIS